MVSGICKWLRFEKPIHIGKNKNFSSAALKSTVKKILRSLSSREQDTFLVDCYIISTLKNIDMKKCLLFI